jgi:ankyrin repeat protein
MLLADNIMLLDLPNESLLAVAQHIQRASDINSLSQAIKQLHAVLSPFRFHNIRRHGASALIWAASYGYDRTVKLMISYGAYVNTRDKYGVTALIEAIRHGHTNVAQLLLQNRADL